MGQESCYLFEARIRNSRKIVTPAHPPPSKQKNKQTKTSHTRNEYGHYDKSVSTCSFVAYTLFYR